jgi:nucleotide-binding universal stress UspA family protein
MAKAKHFGILVATDGSAEATAAVKATVVFPWPPEASVHTVVVRTPLPVVDVPAPVLTDVDRGLDAVAESAKKILAQRWSDVDARVVDGPTVDAILRYADRVRARVVVVGSHGHGPIARLLLGSTSLGIVRRTKHAALIVRGNPRGFARVVVGLDGSPPSRHTVAFLAALEPPAGGEVTLVRVLEDVALPSLAVMPASARAVVLAQVQAENDAAEKKWRREAESAASELRAAGWKVNTVARKGSPLDELLGAAKSARAQLLAVGARGHGALERLLLGSVAEGALHRAPMSVLVVR